MEYEHPIISLPDSFTGVLATSDGTSTGARTMSIVCFGEAFYFQTDSGSEKAAHISALNSAAVAFDNYEIIGNCENLGHPFLPENEEVMRVYKKCFESAYKKYSALEQEVLFRLVPEKIKIWKYIDNKAYQIINYPQRNETVFIELGY